MHPAGRRSTNPSCCELRSDRVGVQCCAGTVRAPNLTESGKLSSLAEDVRLSPSQLVRVFGRAIPFAGVGGLYYQDLVGTGDLAPSERRDLAIQCPQVCTTVWSTPLRRERFRDTEQSEAARSRWEKADDTIGGLADGVRPQLGV